MPVTLRSSTNRSSFIVQYISLLRVFFFSINCARTCVVFIIRPTRLDNRLGAVESKVEYKRSGYNNLFQTYISLYLMRFGIFMLYQIDLIPAPSFVFVSETLIKHLPAVVFKNPAVIQPARR